MFIIISDEILGRSFNTGDDHFIVMNDGEFGSTGDARSGPSGGGEEATVLVVDDERDLADLYGAWLSETYDVRTANGGEEALDVVDEEVDVMLLDRRMPDMSGDEVLAELRTVEASPRVAMLTAVEPETDIVDMAFDDYVTKPVDRSDLFGLIEVLLARDEYDDHSQEFFRLASKKAALEVAGNDEGEEYRQLVDRLEEARDRVDHTLDDVGAEHAFRDFPGGDPAMND